MNTQTMMARASVALALLGALPGLGLAQERASQALDRGAVADTTPQQRYQSAIREAGGGMKIGMAECKAQAGAARKACEQEVQVRYKADRDAAHEMLRNPQARPVNETGGPIRGTEMVIPAKP